MTYKYLYLSQYDKATHTFLASQFFSMFMQNGVIRILTVFT